MTLPTNVYTRIVLAGTISGTQTWSTGLALSPPPSTVSQSDMDALLAAIKPAVTAWWGSSSLDICGINAPTTTLAEIRAYLYSGIPGTGAGLQAINTYATPLVGTSSQRVPVQTALVASMLTGLPGRSFKGRCYTPATGITLGADHQVAQTLLDAIGGKWKALIDSINAVSSPEFGRVVVHGARGNFAVTQVRVDSEPDIQRRRADKILPLRRSLLSIT